MTELEIRNKKTTTQFQWNPLTFAIAFSSMYCFCSYNPCYRYQLATFRTHHHPNCHCSWFAPTFESSTWREPSLLAFVSNSQLTFYFLLFHTHFRLRVFLLASCLKLLSLLVLFLCAVCVVFTYWIEHFIYENNIIYPRASCTFTCRAQFTFHQSTNDDCATRVKEWERESPTRDTSESSNENFSMIHQESE